MPKISVENPPFHIHFLGKKGRFEGRVLDTNNLEKAMKYADRVHNEFGGLVEIVDYKNCWKTGKYELLYKIQ